MSGDLCHLLILRASQNAYRNDGFPIIMVCPGLPSLVCSCSCCNVVQHAKNTEAERGDDVVERTQTLF